MASRNRKRIIRYGGWPCGTLSGVIKSEPAYMGEQTCSDEVHPGPPYRTGGPLLISKRKFDIGRTDSFSANDTFSFNSDWRGYMSSIAYIPSPEPTAMNLAGWGAKGWNRAFPIHPIYQLGVSLIELKDLPGMVAQTWRFFSGLRGLSLSRKPTSVGSLLKSVRNGTAEAAGDYLNLAFGWIPFYQDLMYLVNMQELLARKMAWLKKHNGKSLRRNFDMLTDGFSEAIGRVTQPFTLLSPVLPTTLYAGSVVATDSLPVTKSYDVHIWFRSKWRFYIPELAGLPRDNLLPLKYSLSGMDLDPTVLYKAFPWSWLLDWFVSVGAVVQNIGLRAKYHVLTEYAYVMARERFSYTSSSYVDVHTGVFNFNGIDFAWRGPNRRLSAKTDTIYEFRQREEANPYGFGITYSSLSAYQWSILAALGLSRGSKHSSPRA